MLIIAKMRPSRSPTNTDGSAAGSRIFRNCCAPVSLKLRPTSISTGRVPARPSTVFRITGASPAAKPIITIVVALRPKMTRNSGYISTMGAAASAPTQVSQARRSVRNRYSSAPSAMPTTDEQQARPQHLLRGLPEAVHDVLLDDDARNRGDDLRGQRHDERD